MKERSHGLPETLKFGLTDGPETYMRQQTQAMLTLEDAQRSEHGPEPAARAASPEPQRKLHFAGEGIFEDYDEGAEEAATIMNNGGKLISVLSSKQTQKMAVNLLNKAKDRATLTAFTLDLLIVCNAMVEAAQRGVQSQLFVDRGHSLKGSTSAQMDRLEMLRRGGVEVYLAKGVTAGGIQHSKTLLVDDYYLCGSTNWTSSSRSNHESSMLIELSDEGKKAVMSKLGYVMQSAELLSQDTVKRSQDWREANREAKVRGRSADPSPHRFGETARRFSIARARSRDALLQAQV
jgi:phosphatidylserine/phosphatidylglycerophosphate/cardiolipin synthase-like enzyme